MIRNATIVLGLLVFSTAVGFGLVYFAAPEASSPGIKEPPPVLSPEPASEVSQEIDAGEEEQFDHGSAPPELPPRPVPDGVVLDGPPLYFKCWDAEGDAHKKDCDRLRLFEKRFPKRLYVVDECRRKAAGADAKGVLSLAVQIDFKTREVKSWPGPSSELPELKKFGACVREELAGLPIHGIEAKFERYRLFYTVRFEDPEELAKKLEAKKRRAKKMTVTMSKVNIRYEPDDGMVVGRLDSGDEVYLLKRKDEWCNILTPKDKEAWVICEALEKK